MDEKKFNKEETQILESLLYSQRRKLHLLLDLLCDDVAEEIMKLFAPNTRRRIHDLIHVKMGAIENVLYDLDFAVRKDGLYTNPLKYEWSHEKGNLYVGEILRRPKDKKTSIFERIEEQEGIVSQLTECSEELSGFIRSRMDIEDVVLWRRKKKDA